jgi:hypothetical protein
MIKSVGTAIVLGVCVTALFGASAFAQVNPPAPPKNQSAPPAKEGMPPESQEAEQQEQTPASFAPVLWITSVEAMRSTHGPPLDVIRVRGITSTDGWEAGELVPLTKGTPPDGVLDLAFIALAPTSSTAPSKSPVIEAVFTIEPGHPFKGVRVHGATNRVTLKSIPGYGEAPLPPDDCTNCVGKFFVGKGENPPAGTGTDDVIHEESLPKTLRVVKPTDGIRKLDSDPNRLTIVLGEDGRIVVAVWD